MKIGHFLTSKQRLSIYDLYFKICMHIRRGIAYVSIRGGGRIPTGGTDFGGSKPPIPNSDFSSDFAHFILEIFKNLKKAKHS